MSKRTRGSIARQAVVFKYSARSVKRAKLLNVNVRTVQRVLSAVVHVKYMKRIFFLIGASVTRPSDIGMIWLCSVKP